MEIVLNTTSCGIYLSGKASKRYLELIGKECYFYKLISHPFSNDELKYKLIEDAKPACTITTKNLGKIITGNIPDEFCFDPMHINRTDPILIQVIKELGEEVNTGCFGSSLIIKEVPDNLPCYILDTIVFGKQREVVALK